MKWANWVSIAVITLVVLANIVDLASYAANPDDYHFGTEVAGISYRSAGHFVVWTSSIVLIGGGAIISGALTTKTKLVTAIRCYTAIVLLAASLTYLGN